MGVTRFVRKFGAAIGLGVAELRVHRARAAATGLSVLLTVAFATSAFVVTATSHKALADTGERWYANVDLVVRNPMALSTSLQEVRSPIPASTVGDVRAVPGVAAALPMLTASAQVLDAKGWPVGGNGRETLARNWLGSDPLNPYRLTVGRAPQGDHEIVLDKATASEINVHVGGTAKLLVSAGTRVVRVVGIVALGDASGEAGSTVVQFSAPAMRRLASRPGHIDAVLVRIDPSANLDHVAHAISAQLQPAAAFEVVDRATVTAEVATQPDVGSRFLQSVLVMLTVLAMLVCLVVISSTYGIVVAQRTRELALLRVVGAGRSTIAGSVLTEAAVTGGAAAIGGVLSGVVLARVVVSLLSRAGVTVPSGPLSVPGNAVVIPLCLGVGATLIGVLRPAWRATNVAPLASFSSHGPAPARLRRHARIGMIVVGFGLVGLVIGAQRDALWVVGGSLVACVAGVASLSAPMLMLMAKRSTPWVAARFGVSGQMAVGDLARDPSRAASSMTALQMGVLLLATVAILGSSAAASIDASISRQFKGDFVLQNRNLTGGQVPLDVAQRLRNDDAVREVAQVRVLPMALDGTTEMVAAVDGTKIGHLLDVGVTRGTLTNLGRSTVALSAARARALGVGIGDHVNARFVRSGEQSLRVVAIYRDDSLVGAAMVDHAISDVNLSQPADTLLLVAMRPGPTVNERKQAIQRAMMPYYPAVAVLDVGRYKAAAGRQIKRGLGLITVLLVLALGVALAGMANTMVLSITERRREFGLVRAVGMTREQVRAMVRWEAIAVTVLGTVLGVFTAIAGSAAAVGALTDQGLEVFSVPVRTLTGIIVLAVGAGIAAAIVPIRRLESMTVTEMLGD